MLDLHCHILPAVDDGAVSLEAAVGMARVLVRCGYTAVAPSPHYGEGPGGDVTIERAVEARRALTERLAAEGVALDLLPNAEHHVTSDLLTRADAKRIVPIGGHGPWLLVELPWHKIPDPEGALFRLQAKGFRLLLAHPERYNYLELDVTERLVQRGVKLQLELGSFVEVYGDRALQRAKKLAERGLGHVLASDLHRPEDAEAWLASSLAAVDKRYGKPARLRACEQNPRAMVEGAALDAIVPFTEAS
jgi:protein-tyrosine phosphatase